MALTKVDIHFLNMARIQGEKSPFAKSKRGAVVARGNQILATGVNAHLDEAHSATEDQTGLNQSERYVATINAEVQAIGTAIKSGIALNNITIYTSSSPNWVSFKFLATLGIKRMVFYGPVSGKRITFYAQKLGIEIISVA